MEKQFKVFRLPKGNGKFRTIYSAEGEYKTALKSIVSTIARKMRNLDKDEINFAFIRGRNVVQNAEKHIGHEFTLKMDLQDFFDSVTPNMVKDYLSKEEAELCFIDGVARQGLSTSPSVANLAFFKTDKAILKALKKQGIQAVYTRYADDLTFSFDNEEEIKKIIAIVKQAVTRAGFKVNERKTKVQKASQGRIHITGVAIDKNGVYPTRKILKKIRAAEHQGNENSLQGLKEWAKCKKPEKKIDENSADDLIGLSKLWKIGLRQADLQYIPEKETIELENNCKISGDPVQMLGMSTFTTGWTSCMSSTGMYKKGIPFWILLKGTRVAYEHKGKIEFGKVTGDRMINRCLIHELRNGALVFDKFYGNNTKKLEKELRKTGAISASEARKKYSGEKIVGNVISRFKPYFDNLKSGMGKRKGTNISIRYAYI